MAWVDIGSIVLQGGTTPQLLDNIYIGGDSDLYIRLWCPQIAPSSRGLEADVWAQAEDRRVVEPHTIRFDSLDTVFYIGYMKDGSPFEKGLWFRPKSIRIPKAGTVNQYSVRVFYNQP